jgi:hypothetical protein
MRIMRMCSFTPYDHGVGAAAGEHQRDVVTLGTRVANTGTTRFACLAEVHNGCLLHISTLHRGSTQRGHALSVPQVWKCARGTRPFDPTLRPRPRHDLEADAPEELRSPPRPLPRRFPSGNSGWELARWTLGQRPSHNPTMKTRRATVLVVAAVATAYALVGVTSWKFSIVGDEWTYLDNARAVAEHMLLVNPFYRGAGPDNGMQPLLVSYLQALLMCIFGLDLRGLRISSVVMLFPSLLLLYRFARILIGANAAFFAVILMASSKYLVNFFKIGYGHSICFLAFLLCLYLATRFLRKPNRQTALDLGLSLGFSFYLYIGPLFAAVVAPFILVAVRRNRARNSRSVLVMFCAFVLVACIGFLSTPPELWFGGVARTTLAKGFPSIEDALVGIGRYFLLFFANFDYFYDHYVAGPYLDCVTRWLALAGVLVSLLKFRRRCGLLLCTWCLLCIVLGATNPYPWTPSSRGIFLVPLGTMFAGFGLETIRRRMPPTAARIVAALVLVSATALNVYEAQFGIWKKTDFSRTALIMRELTSSADQGTALLLYHSERFEFCDYHIRRLMAESGIHPSRLTFSSDVQVVCGTEYDRVIVFASDRQGARALRASCPRLSQRVPVVTIKGQYP